MSSPVADATAEQIEQVGGPDLQNKANQKAKKTKWAKAPLANFWEPAPYVPERKGKGKGSKVSRSGEGGGNQKGGSKECKGRGTGGTRNLHGGNGKGGAAGPKHSKNLDVGLSLPRRGVGACVPPRSATTTRDEQVEDKFSMTGRREGGKRDGRGFDGKGGRFNSGGDGCARTLGDAKGRGYGSASDMPGTSLVRNNVQTPAMVQGPEQAMQDGFLSGGRLGKESNCGGSPPWLVDKKLGKVGASVSGPALCAVVPVRAAMISTEGPGGEDDGFPVAPMQTAAGSVAMPSCWNLPTPATHAMPYFMMPATVVGYPNVSAAVTVGPAAPGPSVACATSPPDSGARPFVPNMRDAPPFKSMATQMLGDSDVKSKIMQQIEHCFSTDNLLKDIYLRMHMDEEGWVAVALLVSLPSVRNLAANQDMVADVIGSSSTLELDPAKAKVRVKHTWGQWLLNV